MMLRTHLAVGLAIILIFFSHVNYKIAFVIVALIATLLPDVDMTHSYLGKYKILRPMQWFVKHRGVFHSFTFVIFLSIIFSFYFPIIALPFFLGYSGHLLADSLTPEGIRPYWPSKDEIRWKVKTGGKTEAIIFYSLCVINVLLLVRLFYIL